MKAFTLVTGNSAKVAEAERILGRSIEAERVDLPEIQSLDPLEVLEAKGQEAWERLRRPLVVEETGLFLTALGGFPGPLVKWMQQAAGSDGIARTALALGDARAEARCALLFRDGDTRHTSVGSDHGVLVLPGRGEDGFGWDPFFQPAGEEQTVAELGGAWKDLHGHRGKAWRGLIERLNSTL